MMSCKDIQEQAGYLASLSEANPERQEAFLHAGSCSACQKALAEGLRLVTLLDQRPAPTPPSEALLGRISGQILAELHPPLEVVGRLWSHSRQLLCYAAAVTAAFGLAVGLAKHRAMESLPWSAILFGCALLATANVLRFPAALSSLVVVGSVSFASALGAGDLLAASIGVKCLLIELVAAALPLSAMAYLSASGRGTAGRWSFATVASLGALAGQAGLHLTCPMHLARPHLLLFHSGGVLLALAIGLLASHRFAPLNRGIENSE